MRKHLLLPFLTCLLWGHSFAGKHSAAGFSNRGQAFTENKGQITNQYGEHRADIQFKLRGGRGLNVFVGNGLLVYQWSGLLEPPVREERLQQHLSAPEEPASPIVMGRMEVQLLGANPHATIIREAPLNTCERYYLPSMAVPGTIARQYGKIIYKDIYPHIDWVLYTRNSHLEYDFVLHPGAQAENIRLQYKGATSLNLKEKGLAASNAMGRIFEQNPVSYTEKGAPVATRFVLQDNVLSFSVAPYKGTLTIDPFVEWGTYFGGNDGDEYSYGISTDSFGNIYTAGTTNATVNIATNGAYQDTFAGSSSLNVDAYLNKWDGEGNLIWSTYYGGSRVDAAYGVGLDASGNIYMGGTTSSSGMATAGSYQSAKQGSSTRKDAFIAKFDSSGQRIWSTYYGGAQDEGGNLIAFSTNHSDKLFITGDTYSPTLIATAGTFQQSLGGSYDGFAATFDTAGNLIWGSYYGGAGEDYPTAIWGDTTGNVYITGYTVSTSGIATSGAYQQNYMGNDDGFIAKFNNLGERVWSTYTGGNRVDHPFHINMIANNLYVSGATNSYAGMATSNAFQANAADTVYGDGFWSRWDTAGNLIYGTYYGGVNADNIVNVTSGNDSDIYVLGNSSSTVGMATSNGMVTANQGGTDIFISKWDTSGNIVWSSYAGGANYDACQNATSYGNAIYMTGYTTSSNGIATIGGYQDTFQGGTTSSGTDAFLIKINDCPVPAQPAVIYGDTVLCAGATASFYVNPVANAAYYEWLLPAGWSGSSNTDSIALTLGSVSDTLKMVAVSACGGISDTQKLAITIHDLPEPVITQNGNVLATTQSYTSYQWQKDGADIAGATSGTYVPAANGAYRVRVSNEYGCTAYSDIIEISGLTSVDDLNDNNRLQLYPNPAKDKLFVNITEPLSVSISDVLGRKLMQCDLNHAGTHLLHLNGFAKGVYWVQAINKEGKRSVYKISVVE